MADQDLEALVKAAGGSVSGVSDAQVQPAGTPASPTAPELPAEAGIAAATPPQAPQQPQAAVRPNQPTDPVEALIMASGGKVTAADEKEQLYGKQESGASRFEDWASSVGKAEPFAQRVAIGGVPGTLFGPLVTPNMEMKDLLKDPVKYAKNIPGAFFRQISLPWVRPETIMTPEEQSNHPFATGILEKLGGFSSVPNLTAMLLTDGIAKIPGVGPIMERMITGGFSAEQFMSAFKEVPAMRQAIADHNVNEVERIMTHMTLDLAAALMGAQHAATGEAPKAAYPGMEEAVKDFAVKGLEKMGATKDWAVEKLGKLKAPETKPTTPGKEELAGRVTQLKEPKEIERVTRGLSTLEPGSFKKGMKFDDAADVVQKKIDANDAKVDEILSRAPERYKPNDPRLTIQKPVEGAEPVVKQPVSLALQQLVDFYNKSGDTENLALAKSLQNRFKSQGLTLQEMNQVARMHGSDLSGYSATTNELLSGLNKQEAENTRSDVKDIVRKTANNQQLQAIDENTSDLIATRNAFKDMRAAAQGLANKLDQGGMLQRAYRNLRRYGYTVTPGALAGYEIAGGKGAAVGAMTTMLLDHIIGSGRLDAKSIEANLPKIMSRFDELNKMTPEQAANQVLTVLPPPVRGAVSKVGIAPTVRQAHPTGGTAIPKVEGGPALKESLPASDYDEPKIEGVKTPGIDVKMVMNHELAHVALGHIGGFNPMFVTSNKFSGATPGTIAETVMDWGPEFTKKPDGTLPIKAVQEKLGDILATHMAGAAANELYDGIDARANGMARGDIKGVKEVIDMLGLPESVVDGFVEWGIKRAKTILGHPDVENLINEFSDTREKGLPDSHHYSAWRILEFKDRLGTGEKYGSVEKGNVGSAEEHNPAGESRREAGNAGQLAEKIAGTDQPERTAKVGEKQAKIEGAKLEHPEWLFQQYEREIQRAKDIMRNPDAKPEEKVYAQQVFDSSKALQSKLPAEAVNVPPEYTTGEHDAAIKAAGAVPGGIWKGSATEGEPDMILFHDPTTGSTMGLPPNLVTKERVVQELEKSREQYRQAAKK